MTSPLKRQRIRASSLMHSSSSPEQDSLLSAFAPDDVVQRYHHHQLQPHEPSPLRRKDPYPTGIMDLDDQEESFSVQLGVAHDDDLKMSSSLSRSHEASYRAEHQSSQALMIPQLPNRTERKRGRDNFGYQADPHYLPATGSQMRSGRSGIEEFEEHYHNDVAVQDVDAALLGRAGKNLHSSKITNASRNNSSIASGSNDGARSSNSVKPRAAGQRRLPISKNKGLTKTHMPTDEIGYEDDHHNHHPLASSSGTATKSDRGKSLVQYDFKFHDDGSGDKPFHPETIQYSVEVIRKHSKSSSKTCATLGNAQMSDNSTDAHVLIACHRHAQIIMGRVRAKLRSTHVPTTHYQRVIDPCNEQIEYVNNHHKDEIKQMSKLLLELDHQRSIVEKQLEKGKPKYEQNGNNLSRMEQTISDRIHPSLEKYLTTTTTDGPIMSTNHSKQLSKVSYHVAPKGTMSLFLQKLV